MEQALTDAIQNADIDGCLTVPEFQFKKKRVQLLRLLHSGSRHTAGLSADQIWHVADAVLRQQDERGILAVLEVYSRDERGILSQMKDFLRSSTGEEELWLGASKSASLFSESGFLSDLRTIPVDDFLHEAAIDAEEAAYAILTRQVDALVAGIASETILSTQKRQCNKQIQRENEIKEDGELKILWSNFVRQVKVVSAQRSTSYVACDAPEWTDNLVLRRRIIYNVDRFEAKKLIFSRGLSKISLHYDNFSFLKQTLILTISAAVENFHKKMR
jgi:hypothetical protein